jgi:acetyl-CoA C-acetyltransferase
MSPSDEVVVVDAVRSPIGRRNGTLASASSTELLGDVFLALLQRTGLDPQAVDHVVGGCVNQIGMQASNVARHAWLGAGLPLDVPAVTVNTQCGSSQEAVTLSHGLIAGGIADVAIACGVELMSRIPLGSNVPREPDYGRPRAGRYERHHEPTTQFEGAERIADKWALRRDQLDEFGKRSQDRAIAAWERGHFDRQVVPVEVPTPDGTTTFARDEGLRETTIEALAGLTPIARQGAEARHTAGTASQIADGAGAALLMSRRRAEQLGLRPRAIVRRSVLVGSDPVLMLTGPIVATERLLRSSGLRVDDLDVVEVNEAFASVVLAWLAETHADPDVVNPNGGAIALGHPLGATGTVLLAKVIDELDRTSGRLGLVTMCCGGGLGTGTLLERA